MEAHKAKEAAVFRNAVCRQHTCATVYVGVRVFFMLQKAVLRLPRPVSEVNERPHPTLCTPERW